MSRIFEALQRSESERAGFAFPQPPALATELLQEAEKDQQGPGQQMGDFPPLRTMVTADSRLVSMFDRASLGAEKFRFLGVRLRQMQHERTLKKLLVTSTLPAEGKSVVSANLATTLAYRKQQKVLLLDGDLRRPAQGKLLGAPQLPGLSEWLQAGKEAAPNIHYVEDSGFWVLTAGTPPENPLELIQSPRMPALLDQLSGWFDWVVIDSPPLLPLADSSVWARLVDGVLLVVREGRTERQQLQRGLGVLAQAPVLGAVVNDSSNSDHRNYYSRYRLVAEEVPAAKTEVQP